MRAALMSLLPSMANIRTTDFCKMLPASIVTMMWSAGRLGELEMQHASPSAYQCAMMETAEVIQQAI
jgi:hypothetical protein